MFSDLSTFFRLFLENQKNFSIFLENIGKCRVASVKSEYGQFSSKREPTCQKTLVFVKEALLFGIKK